MVKFLNTCAQIEETAAQIYHEFASDQKCDEALVAIWQKMAKDEEDHAQQLRLAARLPAKETFTGRRDNGPATDTLKALADGILIKARSEGYELLDMLKTAVILEKEFRKIHATYALEFKNPSLLETFKRLARADAEHLKELDAFLKIFREKHRSGSK